jgi:CheY-like chemotaxis protein
MIHQSASLTGLRLLVVEDEAMVAMMIEDLLEAFGCVVVDVAGTLARGLVIARDEQLRLDGAILDINLGGEKVYPIAACLRARNVPFVFSSGYGLSGVEAAFADVPTLAKPYQPEDLENILVDAIGGHHPLGG